MKKEQEKLSDQTTKTRSPNASGWAALIKRWILPVALVGGLVVAYFTGLLDYFSLTTIAENRDALKEVVAEHAVQAAFGFFAVYVVSVAFSIPGAGLLSILSGFLFGWAAGGVLNIVAATIGAVIVFIAAKTSLGNALAERAGPWMEKLRKGLNEDSFNYLLFLRLVPVFPFWLINLAPGLVGVPLGTFVVTTILGIIPGSFAFSFLGSGLDSVIDAQKQAFETCVAQNGADNCTFALDAGSLITPQLLVAFAALGIVALIPVVLKKLRARKAARKAF